MYICRFKARNFCSCTFVRCFRFSCVGHVVNFNEMWLKTVCDREIIDYNLYNAERSKILKVFLLDSNVAPIHEDDKNVRVSKVFPLLKDSPVPKVENCFIYFLEYDKPYSVLGKLYLRATSKIQERIFFNIGICSIVLIVDNQEDYKKFSKLKDIEEPVSYEYWKVVNGIVNEMSNNNKNVIDNKYYSIIDYKTLPLIHCSIIDETVISIQMIKDKASNVQHTELVNNLISITNEIISSLKYIENPQTESITEFLENIDINALGDTLTKQKYQGALIDKLIQINSSLSYVSTQSFSGAIPIYERRSLIRRNSLLGIGSAVSGLNNVFQYVENAFNKIDFKKIITQQMLIAPKLEEVRREGHNPTGWDTNNVDKLNNGLINDSNRKPENKLSYFSSRHSFRESEFCITASLNSLYLGASLEWSLMTLTHEIIHSHIRNLVALIFDFKDQEKRNSIIDKYLNTDQKNNKRDNEFRLIDSIREAILSYCDATVTLGSLTKKGTSNKFEIGKSPNREAVWQNLEQENRSIHEIFVHVLDLHYFYRGRAGLTDYITLIWCSWSVIPNVTARLKQYILRSLLAIASTINLNADEYEKNYHVKVFINARKLFLQIIEGLHDIIISRFPVFKEIEKELKLSDSDFKNKYFGPFAASLILVDIIKRIFYSNTICECLWSDDKISSYVDDDTIQKFSFTGKDEFNDITINGLVPFMLYQVLQTLNWITEGTEDADSERRTAICYLALKSNKQ